MMRADNHPYRQWISQLEAMGFPRFGDLTAIERSLIGRIWRMLPSDMSLECWRLFTENLPRNSRRTPTAFYNCITGHGVGADHPVRRYLLRNRDRIVRWREDHPRVEQRRLRLPMPRGKE